MKSISKTFLVQQLGAAASLTRSLHLGQDRTPTTGAKDTKHIGGDSKHIVNSKISATVRVSGLPKGDRKTEQVPEELRNPAEAMAALAAAPRRSELEQRKARKTQCASQLKDLAVQQVAQSSSQVATLCMPFVRVSHENKALPSADELLEMERDPRNLAKGLIRLMNELMAEKAKSDSLAQSYLELKAELYALRSATAGKAKAASKDAASKDAASSQGQPVPTADPPATYSFKGQPKPEKAKPQPPPKPSFKGHSSSMVSMLAKFLSKK